MLTKRELHGCEKLFLTLNASDWNPYCKSYECNKLSMLEFEGSMCEPSLRSKHQVVFENKDDEMTDLAYTMASINAIY